MHEDEVGVWRPAFALDGFGAESEVIPRSTAVQDTNHVSCFVLTKLQHTLPYPLKKRR